MNAYKIKLYMVIVLIMFFVTVFAQDRNITINNDSSFNFITDTNFTSEEQLQLTISLINLYQDKNSHKTLRYLNAALDLADKTGDISQKKVILRKLALLYHNEFEYENANKQFNALNSLLLDNGTKQEKADAMLLMASNYYDWSKYNKSRDCYIKAKNLYEDIGDKRGLAVALSGLSAIALSYADYELALGQMQLASEVYYEINDTMSIAASSLKIGVIMEKWDRLDRALEYYNQSLNHFIQIEDIVQQANLLLHIGDVYLKKEEFQKARDSYNMALNKIRIKPHKKLESICYSNIGVLCYKTGEYDSALYFQHKALKIKKEVNDRQRIAISLYNLAEIYYALGDYDTSMVYINECIVLVKDMNLKDLEMKLVLLKSQLYQDEGDYKEANILLQEYIDIKNQIFTLSSNKLLNELEVKSEADKIEKENEILRQNDAINKLNLKRRIDTQIIGGLVFLFIIIISVVIIFFTVARNRVTKRNYSVLAKKNKENTLQREELAKLNKELLYSREQYKSIVENATIGIYRTLPDGRIIFANRSLVRMLGYDSVEDIKSVNVTIDYQRREAFKNELEKRRVISGREDVWKRRDGSDMYVYESSWLVCDSDGNILHYEGTVEDISKRKEAERALKKSRFDLQLLNISLQDKNNELELARNKAISANNIKSQFIANISHEIRTPLNSIMGFADIISNKIDIPVHKASLDAIISSSKNLLSLINDLLEMSKIQSGETIVKNEAVDLAKLFEDIKRTFLVKFEKMNLEFVAQIPDNLPELILLDRLKLRQVLYNLINNAINFTEKGTVSMLVECEDMNNDKLKLKIIVADTGIGIPLSEQNVVFEAFNQGAGYKGVSSGAGLGLSLSKRLVEIMGGSIALDSEEGKGSQFTILIPDIRVLNDDKEVTEYNLLTDNSDILFDFHSDVKSFSGDIIVNDNEILKLKENLHALWSEAYSGKVVSLTLHLANEILTFAKENSNDSLIGLSEDMLNAVKGFDVERIDKLMGLLKDTVFEKNQND